MHGNKMSPFLKLMLVLGLAFLYIPLIILVVYSFNDSKLVTVWGGFSTKWYGELMNNGQILDAAWLSLQIAACSSFAAVVLGTLTGYALARIKRFRGNTLFAGLISAPMVMPDVITGLSMLLLIIQVQTMLQGALGSDITWLDRGFFTIFLGHTTLCMAYITVVIRSRLAELDQSLEEAAMDLGARPLKIFFVITLPLIAPAIMSGFLLGITLSLDDVVIASFLSGPGSSTLPLVIFSEIRRGLDPQMNVLATIIIGVVGTLVIVANYFMLRQATKLEREMQAAYKAEQKALENLSA
ncbi:ABC transporter permease subunit [Kingella negevensis]|uniref:ABC transporter permease subunit n=1 Tax=Kingella negevensis TaxID=1522312 RepID=UPI002549DF61|nr:ABC transporter permease subunit [Kingella negevensis]MDK4684634.1 ABC transporter permease subunit [Kingella negevensis]MDK4708143.1 ABC transporter permease subunit [Kingella negevensis]MDK4709708.1 ABC transporter permease subunit [Kingella negevensis]